MLKKITNTIAFLCLHLMLVAQGLSTFDELLSHNFTTTDSLQALVFDARQEYLLKDKGVHFNSSAGSNEFGDLETGNVFRMKAGLEWNILDEGFMDRKVSAQLLEVEKEIQQFEKDNNSANKNYSYLYNHIIFCFNKEKLKYLYEKQFLLEVLIKKYEALYHSHALDYEVLSNILEQMDEVTILRLSVENYNAHFEQMVMKEAKELMPQYLPILRIDVNELYAHQYQDSSFEALNSLKIEKNKLKDKLANQKRLAVYNNIYWRPLQETGSNRYLYNGLGIRFSSPISNRSKERNRLNDLYNEMDMRENEESLFLQQKELSNLLLEYHAKLRTYNRFAYGLKDKIEQQRVEKAVKLVNYEEPQSSVKSLDLDLDRLNIEYELLELKQQLYLLLLKIYQNANVKSLLPFVFEKDPLKENKKLEGDRILQLTGEFTNANEQNFIVEYLIKNEFFNVIFENYSSANMAFIAKLNQSKINVYHNVDALNYRKIIEVPTADFTSRIEMEHWIKNNILKNKNVYFLIKNMDELISIDSYVLEE